MSDDIEAFNALESGKNDHVLRIYSWKPRCISLGYSQHVDKEIDLERAKELGWDVVKRPTGGGIVFHNEAEVTYSFVTAIDDPLLPKGLIPSYKKISEAVIIALSKVGIRAEIQTSPRHSLRFCHPSPSKMERGMNPDERREKGVRSLCFSYPAEYEIVVEGKKIVGSAQKRGRKALLQQGSIFVRRTPDDAFSILKRRNDGVEAVSVEEVLRRKVGFEELSEALREGFIKKLNVEFQDG